VNIRPATQDDVEFLQKMLYEAARWNPDWPREPMEEVLAEPMLTRFHEGWGRPGDAGVIAELDGVPVGAAWYRLFTAEEPGYGFVDEKIPEHPAPGTHGAGARGGLPVAVALGRRSQPVPDDVSTGRVRAPGRGRDGFLDDGREPLTILYEGWSARSRSRAAYSSRTRRHRRVIHQMPPAPIATAIAHATGRITCSAAVQLSPST